MRRSNWKLKLLMAVAVILGVLAGVTAMIYIGSINSQAAGLAFCVTLAIVVCSVIIIGVKVFKIGGR